MNERIKELAEQAQKEVWGNNPYNGSPEFEGYELDTEKFAELIILECRITVGENFHECRTATKMDQILRDYFGLEK